LATKAMMQMNKNGMKKTLNNYYNLYNKISRSYKWFESWFIINFIRIIFFSIF